MENSIENIRRSKQTISEIVITTVIISIGINFVVLGISKELDFNNNLMLIIIGSILIILSLLIISFQKFKQSNMLYQLVNTMSDLKQGKIFSIDGTWGYGKTYVLEELERRLSPVVNEDT